MKKSRDASDVVGAADKKLLRIIGEHVKCQRTLKGLSQLELANQSDIDRTYVSGLERGIHNPSILVLHRVARALDTHLVKLLVD